MKNAYNNRFLANSSEFFQQYEKRTDFPILLNLARKVNRRRFAINTSNFLVGQALPRRQ